MKKKVIISIVVLLTIFGAVSFVKRGLSVSNVPSSLEVVKKVWNEQNTYEIEKMSSFSYEAAVNDYKEAYERIKVSLFYIRTIL